MKNIKAQESPLAGDFLSCLKCGVSIVQFNEEEEVIIDKVYEHKCRFVYEPKK